MTDACTSSTETRVWPAGAAALAEAETHGFAKPRSKLTARAVAWAVDGLRQDDTTVSALARHLGVDWHTTWNPINVEATRRVKAA